MKNRNLFVTGLLSLGLLAACSNDELDNVNNQGTGEGEKTLTQIAISVASADVATRAQSGNTGDPVFGENEEYTVNDLLVVFANTEGIAQEVIVPPMKDVTDADEADRMVRVTEPFSVTPGDYYVYVLANYANSKDALSPIVQNTTDMRTAFKIDATKLSELSESGNFLMSNWTVPVKTTIGSESATGKEVDDAGKEKTGGETLQLLKVDIERVVAKVTFDQTETLLKVGDKNVTGDVTDENKIADAQLTGVGIINLNTQMYMVVDKEKSKTDNKPVATDKDWYYPEDPNYSNNLTSGDGFTAWLANNFTQASVPTEGWATTFNDAKFYCPENTMEATQQKNGVTTGVVYRAKWTPIESKYTTLDKAGTDTYSKRFAAVLEASHDERITADIFTTAEADENGTFYTFNDLIFKSKNAACLYKAIAENITDSDINTNFKMYADETSETTLEQTHGIYKYADGLCYYPVWIKHNPEATEAMQQGKYGVVRNHWYELKVTKISSLGYNHPTYEDPDDPDDPEEVRIQVEANIKQWTLVKQEVEL